jgi:3-hydroxy-9,10-secoandrosta-1,3,5(10)-triene-9,17-dione monooxygenase
MNSVSALEKNREAAQAGSPAASQELIAALRANGAETERLGRLSPGTLAAMQAHGMLSLLKPARCGGLELDLRHAVEAIMTLARGDVSAAWVGTVLNGNDYSVLTNYAPEVADEVFSDPTAKIASVVSVRKFNGKWVDGGVLIEDTTYQFNSGVYHARWDMLFTPLVDPVSGAPDPRFVLIPVDQIEFLNDWQVSGLKGTGSTSIRVKSAFVPRAHVSLARAEKATRLLGLSGNWIYRLPTIIVGSLLTVGTALGGAQGALDLFMEKVHGRGILYTRYKKQSDAAVTHVLIAEASARIEAAITLITSNLDKVEKRVTSGQPFDIAMVSAVRRDAVFAVRLAWEAVDMLASASGGSFLSVPNAMNRFWQDVRAVSQHALMATTTTFEAVGRVACGLNPENDSFAI